MTTRFRAVAGLASVAVAATTLAMPAWSRSERHGPRTVTLTVHYSRFSRRVVTVHAGDEVRFVVHNDDPIDHELIIGDDATQARHERASDRLHHGVAGEVSVPARTVAATVYRFDQPGRMTFACHLPGHFAYGMHGQIDVVE
jgi:uncharacterized cupredoxin-like copper-binding protein